MLMASKLGSKTGSCVTCNFGSKTRGLSLQAVKLTYLGLAVEWRIAAEWGIFEEFMSRWDPDEDGIRMRPKL